MQKNVKKEAQERDAHGRFVKKTQCRSKGKRDARGRFLPTTQSCHKMTKLESRRCGVLGKAEENGYEIVSAGDTLRAEKVILNDNEPLRITTPEFKLKDFNKYPEATLGAALDAALEMEKEKTKPRRAKDKAKRCCKLGVAEMLAELIRDGYALGMDFEEKEAYPYHVWFDKIVRIGGKERGMHADCHGKDALDALVGAIIETYEQGKHIRDGQCKDLLKAIFGDNVKKTKKNGGKK